MNLVIDIGNTRIKAGIFLSGEVVEVKNAPVVDAENLIADLLKQHMVKNVVLSSVANHSDELVAKLASGYNFIYLTHQTRLPFINNYSSPETLGKDRLSAAAGAVCLFPGKNVLVVDAGTCIKCDFVSDAGVYEGGSIAPGILMRYQALNQFTHRLPLLPPSKNHPPLTGDNTENSIHSGVINGAVSEVKAMVEAYSEKFKNISVILSGGDVEYFRPLISQKNNIFADPFLILKGLNYILDYNVKNSH